MEKLSFDRESIAEKFIGNNDTLVYLATPYTHKDPMVLANRYNLACRVAGDMCALGYRVYSPIVHWTGVAQVAQLPDNWEFWKPYCETMLKKSDALFVVGMVGWRDSVGVTAEIAFAKERGLPIRVMCPETLEDYTFIEMDAEGKIWIGTQCLNNMRAGSLEVCHPETGKALQGKWDWHITTKTVVDERSGTEHIVSHSVPAFFQKDQSPTKLRDMLSKETGWVARFID